MKKLVRKNILDPLGDLLKQGLTPKKLAMSLSAGIVICCFPIFGTTTILCIMFAQAFKLNHIAIQLANYFGFPLHVIMLIVFLKIGNAIFGYPNLIFSFDDMLVHFQIDPIGFFLVYSGLALRAVFVWALFAPVAGCLLYYPLKYLIYKISTKSVA